MVGNKSKSRNIEYSELLWDILESPILTNNEITWSFYDLFYAPSTYLKNLVGEGKNLSSIDISTDVPGRFILSSNSNKTKEVSVSFFIKSVFRINKDDKTLIPEYNDNEIDDFVSCFIEAYELVLNGVDDDGVEIDNSKIEIDYNNVRNTFLSLTTHTYPDGHEIDVVKYLPNDLKKDGYGNYYKIIGNSDIMFTSHLDTADSFQKKVVIRSKYIDDDEILYTNGMSILGADDKAGVTVMLYMMNNNVPGLYYFFIGEEVGGLGSDWLSNNIKKYEFMKDIKKCVSFDRRGYNSVITHQRGRPCCSDDFANSLCDEFNKNGLNYKLDDGGVFTDSANFISQIPECTNISVGYYSEHTANETQNITFLEKLCKSCINVNWDKLIISRDTSEYYNYYAKKYSKIIEMLDDMKDNFYHTFEYETTEYSFVIRLFLETSSIFTINEDIRIFDDIFNSAGKDPIVTFNNFEIKFIMYG